MKRLLLKVPKTHIHLQENPSRVGLHLAKNRKDGRLWEVAKGTLKFHRREWVVNTENVINAAHTSYA